MLGDGCRLAPDTVLLSNNKRCSKIAMWAQGSGEIRLLPVDLKRKQKHPVATMRGILRDLVLNDISCFHVYVCFTVYKSL